MANATSQIQTQPNRREARQPAAPPIAIATTSKDAPPAAAPAQRPAATQPTQQTIINNPVIERVIERVVQGPPILLAGYVTLADLASQISAVKNGFGTTIYGSSYPAPASSPSDGGLLGIIGMMGRISNLADVAIANPTITGGSITAGSITGTISNAISSATAALPTTNTQAVRDPAASNIEPLPPTMPPIIDPQAVAGANANSTLAPEPEPAPEPAAANDEALAR